LKTVSKQLRKVNTLWLFIFHIEPKTFFFFFFETKTIFFTLLDRIPRVSSADVDFGRSLVFASIAKKNNWKENTQKVGRKQKQKRKKVSSKK